MANIGSAYLTIFPTMDGFGSKLTSELNGMNVTSIGGKLGKQLSGGMSSGLDSGSASAGVFSGKLSALAGVAGGVAGELAGRLFDSVMGLSGEMIAAADSSQKFAQTLDFAGIDSSTIEQLTASTQAYADQTVYDLADIRNVTAQLAANGVDNYAQLAEAAGNLNAVAGGNSDTFRSVSMVMSQTAGQGKLVTENWNQLTDAIPGASGALEQAMRDAGAFEGNFRDAMANGEISADEFFAAVQKLGMQDVAVEAATSTSTIEGAMGNLQASVVGVGSQLITALNPAITGAMNLLTDVISGIPALLSTYGPQLAELFSPLVTAAQTAWTTLQPLLAQLGSAVMNLLTALSPAIQTFSALFVQVRAAVVDVATQIMAVLLPILTQIINFVTTQIVPVVTPVIQSIVATVQSALPLIQTIITTALSVIQSVWNAVWPALQAVVMPIVQGISSFISGAMTAIQGVISIVMGLISGDWSAVWSGIQQVAQGIWDGISGLVSGAIGAVQGFIDGALSTIQSIWDTAWTSVSDFLSSTWEGIKTGVSDGIDGVVSFLQGLPDTIIGIFSGAGSWLVESGRALLQGFADGVMDAVGWVGDQIGGALDTIRSFFPFSPAKRGPFSGHGYTTYSGRALMTDFGRGIASSTSTAVSDAIGAVSDVESVFAGANARFDATGASALGVSLTAGGEESTADALLRSIDEGIDLIARMLPAALDPATRARFARGAVDYAY